MGYPEDACAAIIEVLHGPSFVRLKMAPTKA